MEMEHSGDNDKNGINYSTKLSLIQAVVPNQGIRVVDDSEGSQDDLLLLLYLFTLSPNICFFLKFQLSLFVLTF